MTTNNRRTYTQEQVADFFRSLPWERMSAELIVRAEIDRDVVLNGKTVEEASVNKESRYNQLVQSGKETTRHINEMPMRQEEHIKQDVYGTISELIEKGIRNNRNIGFTQDRRYTEIARERLEEQQRMEQEMENMRNHTNNLAQDMGLAGIDFSGLFGNNGDAEGGEELVDGEDEDNGNPTLLGMGNEPDWGNGLVFGSDDEDYGGQEESDEVEQEQAEVEEQDERGFPEGVDESLNGGVRPFDEEGYSQPTRQPNNVNEPNEYMESLFGEMTPPPMVESTSNLNGETEVEMIVVMAFSFPDSRGYQQAVADNIEDAMRILTGNGYRFIREKNLYARSFEGRIEYARIYMDLDLRGINR